MTDKEYETWLNAFKEKYNIRKQIHNIAKYVGVEVFNETNMYYPTVFADRTTWWQNGEGYLVFEIEPYYFELTEDNKKILEEWCDYWKFSYTVDYELKPLNEPDDRRVIVFVSLLKSRSKKELQKNGIEYPFKR